MKFLCVLDICLLGELSPSQWTKKKKVNMRAFDEKKKKGRRARQLNNKIELSSTKECSQ